jgi:hypothetical protein
MCYKTSLCQNKTGEKDSCNTFLFFEKSRNELLSYVDNPCPNDTTCRLDLSKAQAQTARGTIMFCMPQGMIDQSLRQEKQLVKLCKEYGLTFMYELFDCEAYSGQTNGCYGLYMDKLIAQKFGEGFKEYLLQKADSLFVSSYPTVYFTKCDTLPRLFDRDIHHSLSMNVPVKKELLNNLKISMYGYYPQVDIGFYIDTAGNPSKYFLSQFIIYDGIEENRKYQRELTKIAFDYIRQFKIWKPGVILNKKIRTVYNVRISFVSETEQ